MDAESKEIYPNAPLRLVAFEARYPLAMKLGTQETLAQFQSALEDDLPNVELGVEAQVTFNPQQGFQELPTKPLFRLYSRTRRTAVTLGHAALVVETSEYERYANFRDLVERCVRALTDAAKVPGLTRVGLRYVNEVRAPDVAGPRDWEKWVNRDLLSPIFLCDLRPSEYQGRLQFDLGAGHGLQMNTGTLQGEFVSSAGPLRVEKGTGPFFLVDIDSYSNFEELEDFEVESAMALCDKLRQPVRTVFEASITESLRNEVLRVEQPDVESTETPQQEVM